VLLSSVFSGRLGHVRRQGLAVERSILVYGAAILGFGGVLAVVAFTGPSADPSLAGANAAALVAATLLLAVAGAADNVSSIFRMTILQASAPDVMRGRLQGVFTVVVTGGPRLGDLYVGVLALTGVLWFPPVLGGLLIVVLVSAIVRLQGSFRRYDALAPTP
jgi:hypothetical protein